MQAVKITDNSISEFLGIKNLVLAVADPVTGRFYRKTLVKTMVMDGNGAIALAADSILRDIIIIPKVHLYNVKVGTTPGADDLVPETQVGTNGVLLSFNQYIKAAQQIHLTGLAAATEVKLIIF